MPFLIALALALVLTPAARFVGQSVGLVDRPTDGELKIHGRPIPVLGGVSVVVATLASASLVGTPPAGTLAAVVAVVLLMGIVDDVKPLPPAARIAIVTAAGVLLGLAWTGGDTVVRVAFPLLVLACANAVNLLDGQDGLAGGTGAIAALGLAWLAHASGLEDQVMGLALAGALVGFLVWNRPPARIYLGNGGAYAIGVVLAWMAVVVVSEDGWRGLLAAGVCLSVFAFELMFTMLRRVRIGGSLFRGDRQHSYDLMAVGQGSRSSATLSFWGLAAAAATLGSIIGVAPLTLATLLAAAVALGAASVAFRLSFSLGRGGSTQT